MKKIVKIHLERALSLAPDVKPENVGYRLSKLVGAVTVFANVELRVGDRVTETQAGVLAADRNYEVTVTQRG